MDGVIVAFLGDEDYNSYSNGQASAAKVVEAAVIRAHDAMTTSQVQRFFQSDFPAFAPSKFPHPWSQSVPVWSSVNSRATDCSTFACSRGIVTRLGNRRRRVRGKLALAESSPTRTLVDPVIEQL